MARMICGFFRLNGAQADPKQLDAMLDSLRPAGMPWAQDQIIEGPLAMAVVEIGTPGSVPIAPSMIRTTRGLLGADIRLYGNVDTLVAEHQLAQYFEEDRLRELGNCHGDFAFAHWHRECRRLTLGRDHFGVRPLQFTVHRGEYAAFASLPSALLRTNLASRALDEAAIASFPVNGQPLPGRTFFRDIRSVPAAHVVEIDENGNSKSRRYWRLSLEPALPLNTDPMQAAAEIRRLLEQAVRRRLPPTGPAASHMSGGLDSTPIAILAARALQAEGRVCLAYSFQEARTDPQVIIVDEAPYVAEAAKDEPNLQLRPIASPSYFSVLSDGVDPDTMLPITPDEPEEAVLIDAAENGATVLFSGWGGDQVVTSFGGDIESEMLWAGHWSDLTREIKSRSRLTGRSFTRELFQG